MDSQEKKYQEIERLIAQRAEAIKSMDIEKAVENSSVPFDGQSGKASIDLKPVGK